MISRLNMLLAGNSSFSPTPSSSDFIMYGAGNNYYSQLGFYSNVDVIIFTQSTLDTNWDTVTTTEEETLAIKDGALFGVGRNSGNIFGFGNNTPSPVTEFTQIGNDTNWQDIKSGSDFIIGLKDGKLYGGGYDYYGELGQGTSAISVPTFTQIGSFNDWEKIVCGKGYHTAAIRGGKLYLTGINTYGQLGLGDNINRSIFTQVGSDTDWDDVACGYGYSVALKGGRLFATGENNYGQLGLGDNIKRSIFTQVGSDSDWEAIACGDYYTLAIKAGELYGAGINTKGQLGISDLKNKNVFTKITVPDSPCDFITCGGNHSFVIIKGKLFATGENGYGQLGLNDLIDRSTFTQVGSDTNWTMISTFKNHTIGFSSLPIMEEDFSMLVRTISSEQIVVLPLVSDTNDTADFTIDWGDESEPQVILGYNSPNKSHTYEIAGDYIIKISGNCLGSWNSLLVDEFKSVLIKILSWGIIPFNGMTRAFYECTLLESIPENSPINVTENITSLDGTFQKTAISSIPPNLFENCVNITNFYFCFGDTNIFSIPSGLFLTPSLATNFSNCFRLCLSLTTVPEDILSNNLLVDDVTAMFSGDSNITSSVPTLWISFPTAEHNATFSSCNNATNYSDIPVDWR